jgi:hypothetical protein
MASVQIPTRVLGFALAALILSLLPAPSASAQGLFEMLFGGFRRPVPPTPLLAATPFADPLALLGNEGPRHSRDDSGGGGMAFCVRTCDGRFFPLQRNASASAAEVCKSFCPSARTIVFHGSKIDYAVASSGVRYSDLANAFVYRKRVVDNCTCNGKDAFGLAQLNVASDPTLRQGDIVATNDGLATYNGGRNSRSAAFTPINSSSSEWSRQLAMTKVMQLPEPQTVTPIAEDHGPSHGDRRRAVQLIR